ncbi:MAG: hypothetical protein PWP07_918 [Epulopiscium sp.]|jgi:hypothetical protein|uniref:Uncharacterized protein n=1 Tax=Defluviitalea raffinosedens TaxID=1450156 RepID=A0A7C8HD86_9FIRM|nr:hypothetical protein [Defluviitalea raffinosedens]MBZ4668558.1 hypothetical protein [Defluviitaleaceae bacterium]MDK2787693.1 hypothetical protein [Candidatus Epulonipiscium sp.]KAE9629801.1 hypothetical protein GND95_12740 [Defluviitalea raffinosedens]MBM7686593.1 hypothetical protein [Defluviitalea raffinosedens]NLL71684.1 hypothetical protein [Candidatus Epulonipiscium sp.]
MATVMNITEINIITVDKSDDVWLIEGEITFEEELLTTFQANYNSITGEFEELDIETDPKDYDEDDLKEMILKAVENYE